MKRYFSLLIVGIVSYGALYADSYRDALKVYLSNNNSNSAQYESTLGEAFAKAFPQETDKEKIGQIMSEYAATQMADDMADIFLPSFKKYVSEAELKELIELYQNERFAALQNKSAAIMSGLVNDEDYLQFMNSFGTALGNIVTGQPVVDLPVPANITESYVKTFNTYYEDSMLDEMIGGMFESVYDMVKKGLIGQGMENVDDVIEKVKKYTATNMRTVLLVTFHKAYSEDDIKYMSLATASDAYRHSMQATMDVVSNPLALSLNLFEKMSAWLKANYPQYGAAFDELISTMKTMM
ncbi:MAG: hypothetical protein IJS13_07295 [Paludibacteraceae bacterium]|nr:hypothetical protein [Paludibacteraceae bacterium]